MSSFVDFFEETESDGEGNNYVKNEDYTSAEEQIINEIRPSDKDARWTITRREDVVVPVERVIDSYVFNKH